MKFGSFIMSALALISSSAFANEVNSQSQMNSTVNPVTGSCLYTHSWSYFRSYQGEWEMSISKSYGSPYFYFVDCSSYQYEKSQNVPILLTTGNSGFHLGLGFAGPAYGLTYYVTGVEHSNSIHSSTDSSAAQSDYHDHNNGPVPNPVVPPTPVHNLKKCVFVVNGSDPKHPTATVYNYNNAHCSFIPGSSVESSQFIFQ